MALWKGGGTNIERGVGGLKNYRIIFFLCSVLSLVRSLLEIHSHFMLLISLSIKPAPFTGLAVENVDGDRPSQNQSFVFFPWKTTIDKVTPGEPSPIGWVNQARLVAYW